MNDLRTETIETETARLYERHLRHQIANLPTTYLNRIDLDTAEKVEAHIKAELEDFSKETD